MESLRKIQDSEAKGGAKCTALGVRLTRALGRLGPDSDLPCGPGTVTSPLWVSVSPFITT